MNESGLRHINLRKRISKKLNKYPHPKKSIRILDRIMLIVAIIGPLFAIPQIYQIFWFKDASGISIISFSFFSIFNILWIFYGIVHKDKPLLITYVLWFIVNLTIVVGAYIY
jgi:uncharacterized protein with PQ loop repeat